MGEKSNGARSGGAAAKYICLIVFYPVLRDTNRPHGTIETTAGSLSQYAPGYGQTGHNHGDHRHELDEDVE